MKTEQWAERSKRSGFTIVELLIVIVVIGILAAISIVAYNGIQQRALDATRVSDVAKIKQALLAYNSVNGGVPRVITYKASTEPFDGGWDVSTYDGWLSFLRNENGEMPRDPKNFVNAAQPDNLNSRVYKYYCYGANYATTGEFVGKSHVRLTYKTDASGGYISIEAFVVDSCL